MLRFYYRGEGAGGRTTNDHNLQLILIANYELGRLIIWIKQYNFRT